MSSPPSSPAPRVPPRHTATVTVRSCLMSPPSKSMATSSSFSSDTRDAKKRHYVLTVELDKTVPAGLLTRLTVQELRRTIERVLFPRESSPPYRLCWSAPRATAAMQPSSSHTTRTPISLASSDAAVVFAAAGDDTVRVWTDDASWCSSSSPRLDGRGASLSWTEGEHKVPAGVVVEVYAGEASAKVEDIFPASAATAPKTRGDDDSTFSSPRKTDIGAAPQDSAMSSPKRSTKNVSFVFDEAVVRAQEPPPHTRTSFSGSLHANSVSGRLPLRRAPLRTAATAVTPVPKEPGESVMHDAIGSAQAQTMPSVERFHRTHTPSPLRDDTSATVAPPVTMHRTAPAPPAPASPSTASSTSNTPSRLSSSSSAPTSPCASVPPSEGPHQQHPAASLPHANGPIATTALVDQTLPYTEASTLVSTTVTESATEVLSRSVEHLTQLTRQEEVSTSSTGRRDTRLQSPVSSSRSMSSPAFSSFYSATLTTTTTILNTTTEKSPLAPRCAHGAASSSLGAPTSQARSTFFDRTPQQQMTTDSTHTATVTTATTHIITSARHSPTEPTSRSYAAASPTPTPSRTAHPPPASTTSARTPRSRPSCLLSPLPIDVEDTDDEGEMGAASDWMSTTRTTPTATAARTSTATTHTGWRREDRQLRYSESPPPSPSPSTGAGSLRSAPHEDDNVDSVRTSRDVLRAAERVLWKYNVSLGTQLDKRDALASATTTATIQEETGNHMASPSPHAPSSPPPSAALVSQLDALSALVHRYHALRAQQVAEQEAYEAEKRYCAAQHDRQMRELTDFVTAQTAAWQAEVDRSARRTGALDRASERLSTQEATAATRLAKLQRLSEQAQHALTQRYQDLAQLPERFLRAKQRRALMAPLAVTAMKDSPRSQQPREVQNARLKDAQHVLTLAGLLVSETAFMQDDVAYLAALRYRGAEQAAFLRTLTTSHAKTQKEMCSARVASSLRPVSLRAVPVCCASVCVPPPLSASSASSTLCPSFTAWLAGIPSACRSPLMHIREFYLSQASVRQQLTMNQGYGVFVKAEKREAKGAQADRDDEAPRHVICTRRITLYDPRRRLRAHHHTQWQGDGESMAFPAIYSMPDGFCTFDARDDAPRAALAHALASLFRQEVVPVLYELMRHGEAVLGHHEAMARDVPAGPSKAAILLYGAGKTGKTTHAFGLAPDVAALDGVSPQSHGRDDTRGDDTLHFSLSSDNSNIGGDGEGASETATGSENSDSNSKQSHPWVKDPPLGSPSSAVFSVVTSHSERASTTDFVLETASLATSPVGAHKQEKRREKEDGAMSANAPSPKSTLSLQSREEDATSVNLTGLTPLREVAPSRVAEMEEGTQQLPHVQLGSPTATSTGAAKARTEPTAPVRAPADGVPIPGEVETQLAALTCGWGQAEGVLPRTLAWLLARRHPSSSNAQGRVHRVELSAVEVYHDQLYDLLAEPLPPPALAASPVGKGAVKEARPVWVAGAPSSPPAQPRHPSHLKPLSLTRARRRGAIRAEGNSATHADASWHATPGGDEREGVRDDQAERDGEEDTCTRDGLPTTHEALWATGARRVIVNSTADACGWLQVIADRRCCEQRATAAPTATAAVSPQEARTPHATTTSGAVTANTPFLSSHVIVRVHVQLIATPERHEASEHEEQTAKTRDEAAWVNDVTRSSTAAMRAECTRLQANPLRVALNLTSNGEAAVSEPTAPKAATSDVRRPRTRSSRPAPRTHSFVITFADLAGSVRQDAFTQLPSTRAARDGARCVRRQLNALRDVLDAIAQADATAARANRTVPSDDDLLTTRYDHALPSSASFSGSPPLGLHRRGPTVADSSRGATTTDSAAMWDPLREWSLAVPKLGEGVLLTTCTRPLVVADCPLPHLESTHPAPSVRTGTHLRTPHRTATKAAESIALSSITSDGLSVTDESRACVEASFRRALRPWLPRSDSDASDEVDEDEGKTAPPSVPVPPHIRIPYYRSPLTQLLQPTLGPGPTCRTLVLVCVKPCSVVEYLPSALQTLLDERKNARAHGHRARAGAIAEETILAAAQAALARSAPLRLSEAHSSLALAQRLNSLSGNPLP